MTAPKKLCFLTNTASGSYSEAAVDGVLDTIRQVGFTLAKTICFPKEGELPTPDALDREGIDLLAIFTGDGTINAAVTGLYGWGGAVLVLPGGTMNLLSQQLHGDVDVAEILARVAKGKYRKVRRNVVRSSHGDALVGFSAGPATSWYNVREAMRDADIQATLDRAGEALHETMQEPYVRVRNPDLGEANGYPLIEVLPEEGGLRIVAYNAQTLGEYVQQGVAMLLRRFREGPHEVLGCPERLTVENCGGRSLQLSIDGEPTGGASCEELSLARAEVDLLATG